MLEQHHRFIHSVFFQSNPSNFWETFFAEFLASLIILIIGSFFVPWVLDWRKRPHLEIVNPDTRGSVFWFTRSSDGAWEATLKFAIKNKGRIAQREWFWHLIVPEELQQQLVSLDPAITHQENMIGTGGKKWKHYFGSSQPKEIIYAGRGLRFNYELKIKTQEQNPKFKIHYYFSTEFGTWPKKAEQIEEVLEKPEVVFSPQYLSSIDVEPHK